MRWILVLLMACGDNIDVGVDAVQPDVVDAAVDASIDAQTDAAACWMVVHPMCDGTLLDLCVPYVGCAQYMCNGVQMGYCGPGEP